MITAMIANPVTRTDTMDPPVKEKKALSFSITSILGTDDNQTSSDDSKPPTDVSAGATVHHYGAESEYNYYTHFDTHVRPRACSTPENDAYPSPTPTYPRMSFVQYGVPHGTHLVPGSLHVNTLHTPDFYPAPHLANNMNSNELPSPEGTIASKKCSSDSNRLTPEVQDRPLKAAFGFPERSNDNSLDSLGESYNYSPSPMKCKKKKSRTVFSRNQVYQLESAFDLKRYLSSAERSALAARLSLSETQIKIWFQNRRNKWKRQINGEMDEIPIPPAFSANFLPYAQPSYNSYGHVLDSREELFRGALSGQSYYSHPYMHDSRKVPTLLR